MKRLNLLALVFLLAPAAAQASDHNFGLGVQVGAPTGLAAKLYLGKPFALQMGIGVVDDLDNDPYDDDGLHIYLDAVWHPAVLARTSSFTMPLYIGVGGRIVGNDDHYRVNGIWYSDDETRLGVRVPFGLLMDFNRVPLDIFLELTVVVDLVELDSDYDGPYDDNPPDAGLNGGIGIRYYF